MLRSYDVILVGGGITGLMSAKKLCDIGLHVALVEQHSTLASGPSTRNEGWLHRGTYHAASIRDRHIGIQVARRCIYGHEQLRRFCSEAIEDGDVRPIVMIADGSKVDEVVSRWKEADVQVRPISHAAASKAAPTANFGRVAALFEANDVSVNTRLLYRKLFAMAQKAGCDFYVEHQIERIDGQTAVLKAPSGDLHYVQANKFVYSAGTGARAVFQKHHGVELPIRYWKSHLVITKRLAPVGLFYVDPHEAAMMHHGDVSVIGLNEDALLSPTPSYDVIADRAENLRNAIRRIFPNWSGEDSINIACTKVDLVANATDARSLDIAIREPIPGHVCVLPGKMTEAPYLTDILVSYIHQALDSSVIALRPCDRFEDTQQLLEVG
ncbi:FAD-binding oxidoreductase [Ensifer sp. ENS05]|nr:FAD-binding oxidoreductase [Ensifer sp. ENS05]